MSQLEIIQRVVSYTRRIAVVGLSSKPWRPSNGVARTLLDHGFEIIPVNPDEDEVLGVPAVDSLDEIDGEVELVDVFRRQKYLAEVAEQAVAIGPKGLWLQQGLFSQRARDLAAEAGIDYVEDACLAVEVERHLPSR